MRAAGTHLVVELSGCSPAPLRDAEALQRLLCAAAVDAGFTVVGCWSHQFLPAGATVLVIIGESHLALHSYPEAGHVSLDIFACAPDARARMERLIVALRRSLEPHAERTLELLRGNPLEVGSGDWFTAFSPFGFDVRYHIRRHVYSECTPYQRIDIIENDDFGRMLFLDRDLQVADSDGGLYSHLLTAPLDNVSPAPEHVVILGGGDGGVLHHALLRPVKRAVLVDLDEAVVRASRQYLPTLSAGAFDDPRAELRYQEATAYLADAPPADAVLVDLTMHPEAMTQLERDAYLDRLFAGIARCLVAGGVYAQQCGSAFDRATLALLEQLLPRWFDDVRFYSELIPSFCQRWVFASARGRAR